MLRRRRKLPSPNKKRTRFLLILPILLVLGLLILGIKAFFFKPHFISALPDTLKVEQAKSDPDEEKVRILMEKNGFMINKVEVASDSGYTIFLTTGEEIIVSSENLSSQISSLQSIVTNLTMEGKRIQRLDIRFEKPVVLFK